MKILFVASGNTKTGLFESFICSQQESLEEQGYEVPSFRIVGKGLYGYLKNIRPLRAFLKENPVDLIHVHYTLSGWVAVLAAAGKIPIVLSLMGGDAEGIYIDKNKVAWTSRWLTLLTWLIQPFVHAIISKSPNLEKYVYNKQKSYLIPNGVNMNLMKPLERDCRQELGFSPGKKYVLFLGNPTDVNKNFALAKAAMATLNRPDVQLIAPYPVPHKEVVRYLNAADVFVLCSFTEGSPNAVKEAMACNSPMVVTNAGDVTWLLGDTPGCYISSFETQDFVDKLAQAIDFSERYGRTQGRNRILELGLDTRTVADQLSSVYQRVINKSITKNPKPANKQTVSV
jgi:glycosyltransferase involved in cell wall biosynthesis